MTHERFLIVDLGSQYAQLIARRVREQGCYAEIVMPDVAVARVLAVFAEHPAPAGA